MATVTRAVILAAGLGSRMLPATKTVPKEMLAVVDRPLIQYAVDECLAAGITEIVFVVAEGKEAIRDYYTAGGRTETMLRAAGNERAADALADLARAARFEWVLQDRPLGIAHAVNCARTLVEGEPFALLFPDDLLIAREPVIGQLARVYDHQPGSVVAVQPVAREEIPQYGIVDPAEPDKNPARLRGIVEKPAAEDAPSNLGVVGRYILSPTIFRHIDRIEPGKNGELQITDAFASQIRSGETVSSFRYEGKRYDTGRPLGLILASVGAALAREDLAGPLRERLAAMLSEGE
jgi:UTP--glucose-1-phosphate uridylyltransferase